MNKIGKRINYLPATNDPLSADVYCIEGDKYCYVYDVGNDDRSLQYINQIGKEKVVVLSHYHKDHTGNIVGLHYRDLYVGKKHTKSLEKASSLRMRLQSMMVSELMCLIAYRHILKAA